MQVQDLKIIGHRIKTIRKLMIGGQADLAKEAGLNIKTISFVENGHSSAPQQLLHLLAVKYQYRIDWILTGKGEERSTKKFKYSYEDLYIKVLQLELEMKQMRELLKIQDSNGSANQ